MKDYVFYSQICLDEAVARSDVVCPYSVQIDGHTLLATGRQAYYENDPMVLDVTLNTLRQQYPDVQYLGVADKVWVDLENALGDPKTISMLQQKESKRTKSMSLA